MARPKPAIAGKRINIWVPGKNLQMVKEVENFSGFIQICLDQAPDIMAWAILRKAEPVKYRPRKKLEDVIGEFNEKFPLDPLTQKRLGKCRAPSRPIPDSLY